jgi:hypothetical protein
VRFSDDTLDIVLVERMGQLFTHGATTLIKMTLSIMTLSIMALSTMTLSIMTLSIIRLS